MKTNILLLLSLILTLATGASSFAKEREDDRERDREIEREIEKEKEREQESEEDKEKDESLASESQENAPQIFLTEEDLSREEKAKQKVEKIFDKQFVKFRKRIKRLIREFSDAELRQMLEESVIRSNDALNSSLINSRVDSLLSMKDISLSNELKKLGGEKFKEELKANLAFEANRLGSYRALLKELRDMEVNKCLLKKTAMASVIILGTGVGVGILIATTPISAGLTTSLIGGVLILDAVAISPIDRITKNKTCDLVKK